MPLQPKATKAVLDHVMDDPVRGEELCSRRDILFADLDVLLQVSKDFILRFGIVILIQPADNLHLVSPVLFRNHGDHLLDDAALAE